MADNQGPDAKPTQGPLGDSKPADGKSAAVKPPVLDLKARDTAGDAAKAENKTEKPKPAEPLPSSKPTTATTPASAPVFPLAATLAGGVLGLAAAYGLALAGLWPAPPTPAQSADPRLGQLAAAIPELQTVTQTTQDELATLNQRLGALEDTGAPAEPSQPIDVASIEADIAALGERIETLSAAPAPNQTGDVEAVQQQIDALREQFGELGARLGTAEASLRDLDTTVGQTSAALAQQPSDISAVLQLPLVLSGLETAFSTGRSYEAELAALRAAVPETTVPLPIANAASTGLARPDQVATQFNDAIPAMLAARPIAADAQWQSGAIDWLAGVVALRPTSELEGDTPEAVMSRLEGAVARRDWVSAQTLLEQLPAPMRDAAGALADDIAAQAEASRFLQTLRSQALAGEGAS